MHTIKSSSVEYFNVNNSRYRYKSNRQNAVYLTKNEKKKKKRNNNEKCTSNLYTTYRDGHRTKLIKYLNEILTEKRAKRISQYTKHF